MRDLKSQLERNIEKIKSTDPNKERFQDVLMHQENELRLMLKRVSDKIEHGII